MYLLRLQKSFNGRLKGLHVINAPPFVDTAVTLLKSILKPKLAARVSTPIHKTL
jgi:hypothetical protein